MIAKQTLHGGLHPVPSIGQGDKGSSVQDQRQPPNPASRSRSSESATESPGPSNERARES